MQVVIGLAGTLKTAHTVPMSRDDPTDNPSFITSGFPNAAKDALEVPLDLNAYLIQRPASTFYVRADGDLLRSQGVLSGDLLLVDKSMQPKPDDFVVIAYQGELAVKQYKRSSQGQYFITDDTARLTITADLEFEIWGTVISIIRKLQ